MSWLSSLFHGTHTTQPDTSAQEAELQREREAEDARIQALLDQQQRIYDQQRTDSDARAQAQLAAQQAQAQAQQQATADLVNRQITAQQTEYDRQYQAQQAAESRREAEYADQQAQAAEHARLARTYATGREHLIDTNKAAIDSAYSGFDDGFYKNFEGAFVDANKPQVEENYRTATKQATYGFGDAHNLRSSAAARAFGDLAGQRTKNEAKLAGAAVDNASTFRDSIEGQKADAMGLLFQAGATGQPDLPDGFTDADVSGALGGIGTQLGSISQSALARAKAIKVPSFDSTGLSFGYATKRPGGMVSV